MAETALAFDRASVRSYDKDGRLHVEITNISKAAVNPYFGREIPNWQGLGLDAAKVYRLLRDPSELEKAAPTFNGLPLLAGHKPTTADDHPKEMVVGSTGTDAVFEAPYLRNSLVIWTKADIEAVNADEVKELSSGYRYRADMTPGEYEGEPYDGVMRDIVGNHVALVSEGRAGPDVVVGDSNGEFAAMARKPLSRKAVLIQGAALAALTPKLAADAKIDLSQVFTGITSKNFKDRKADILAKIAKKTTGKLAQDASIEDLAELLDTFDDVNPIEDEEPMITDPNDGAPEAKAEDAETPDLEARLAALEAAVAKMVKAEKAEAEETMSTDEEDPEAEVKDKAEEDDADKVSKPAMDAAIQAAVKKAEADAAKRMVGVRNAEKAIRPYVGELAVAMDSADAVYETALKMLGVKVDGVHPSAFPAILAAQPLPGSQPKKVDIAQDAAASKGFAERHPNAARIRTI